MSAVFQALLFRLLSECFMAPGGCRRPRQSLLLEEKRHLQLMLTLDLPPSEAPVLPPLLFLLLPQRRKGMRRGLLRVHDTIFDGNGVRY